MNKYLFILRYLNFGLKKYFEIKNDKYTHKMLFIFKTKKSLINVLKSFIYYVTKMNI